MYNVKILLNMSNIIEHCLDVLHEETTDLYLCSEVAERTSLEPLEFYREFISKNVPVVVRGGCSDWPAVQKWNTEYFRRVAGAARVTVAATPGGRADAVERGADGREYFALPEERVMTMNDFLDRLECPDEDEVLYIQQQNSNLCGELSALRGDAPAAAGCAAAALRRAPDAVNFWMGDGRAVSSTHKDPYENVYCVVRGHKDFVLTPPTERARVPHRRYPPARWARGARWTLRPLPAADHVPWVSVEPTAGAAAAGEAGAARALAVRVRAGDWLYLPSLWFHRVAQSHGAVAVNYWYDMDFDVKYCYYRLLEALAEAREREQTAASDADSRREQSGPPEERF